MLNKIINKLGVDKILHFCIGTIITSYITNIVILQDGLIGIDCIWIPIIGMIVTMIFEYMKEYIIDDAPDKKDILATFLGTFMSFVINLIGVLFYIWSH